MRSKNSRRIPCGIIASIWDQYAYFKKTRQTRFAQSVQTLYALRQAIIEAKLETMAGRYARYNACWEILVHAIKRLNLKTLVLEKARSRLITAIIMPDSPKYWFDDLRDRSRESGFTIYPEKLSDAATFRMVDIGDIRPEETSGFMMLLEHVKTL
jgi:2-aminoethylphosphonate-pyruvate transaminase